MTHSTRATAIRSATKVRRRETRCRLHLFILHISTQTKAMVAPNQSTDSEIRARLLWRLGIESQPSSGEHGMSSQRHLLINAETTRLPLKPITPRTTKGFFGRSKSNNKGNGYTRIQFDSNVNVVFIPSHRKYSSRIKKFLWSSSSEIRQNAQRNLREFASENWKWEDAVEEQDMYLDTQSNEYIHPVHLRGFL